MRKSILYLVLTLFFIPTILAQPRPKIEAQRVWSGDLNLLTGDISPDGRYVSDINWDTGDFQLLDLKTGEIRTIAGVGYDVGRYAWTSAFSSDGRRIALSCYVNEANSHELRVRNLDGGEWRLLVPASQNHFSIDPVDWSPSGKEIIVAMKLRDRSWQLGLVSVGDGSMRIVKKLGWQAPGGGHDQAYPHAKVSPDGKFVAYDYPPANERTRDIYAVTIDGKREIKLVSGRGSDRLLGWIPDGSGILFYSDRSNVPALWRQRVRDDQPIGKPELIRSGVRDLIPMGFTQDGYAYGLYVEAEHVYTSAVDMLRGRVIEPPRPIPDLPTRKILTADWSPDGRQLLYATQGAFPDPVETFMIRTANGKPVRTIPLPTGLHTSNGTLRWSAPEIVFVAGYEKGLEGIYEVNLRRATSRRLPTPATIAWGTMKWFEVGPGGHTIYMIRPPKQGGGESDLLAYDVATGELRVIGTARADAASLAVSPDGKELAYLARDDSKRLVELQVVSARGIGETRTLHRAPGGKMRLPVAWTPDGSRLLFALRANNEDSALWSIAARGGEPIRLLPDCCGGNDIRINRDGRRIAFVSGSDRSEIWVMKGF